MPIKLKTYADRERLLAQTVIHLEGLLYHVGAPAPILAAARAKVLFCNARQILRRQTGGK